MAKITLDLNRFKASGVYTIEFDASERLVVSTQTIRLVVGFSRIGPFNAPVFLRDVATSRRIFGRIDSILEARGSFFHRSIETCLSAGPIFALNLLPLNNVPVNEGGDAVDYRSMALAADEENGIVTRALYSSFYNKERFWFPDTDYLQATVDSKPTNRGRLFNVVNLGQQVASFIVRKSSTVTQYNVTAEEYYGADEIPPYVNPQDYLSDYFVDLYIVKGDWTNLPLLSQDPTYSKYFDLRGIKADRLDQFVSLDGITLLGSFTGCIIPNFIDNNGSNQSIDTIINSNVAVTGFFININEAALSDYENSVYKVDMVGNTLINTTDDTIDFLSYNTPIKNVLSHTGRNSVLANEVTLKTYDPLSGSVMPYMKSVAYGNTSGKFCNVLAIPKPIPSDVTFTPAQWEALLNGFNTNSLIETYGAAIANSGVNGSPNPYDFVKVSNVIDTGTEILLQLSTPNHTDTNYQNGFSTTPESNYIEETLAALVPTAANTIEVSNFTNLTPNANDVILVEASGYSKYFYITAVNSLGATTELIVGTPLPSTTFYFEKWCLSGFAADEFLAYVQPSSIKVTLFKPTTAASYLVPNLQSAGFSLAPTFGYILSPSAQINSVEGLGQTIVNGSENEVLIYDESVIPAALITTGAPFYVENPVGGEAIVLDSSNIADFRKVRIVDSIGDNPLNGLSLGGIVRVDLPGGTFFRGEVLDNTAGSLAGYNIENADVTELAYVEAYPNAKLSTNIKGSIVVDGDRVKNGIGISQFNYLNVDLQWGKSGYAYSKVAYGLNGTRVRQYTDTQLLTRADVTYASLNNTYIDSTIQTPVVVGDTVFAVYSSTAKNISSNIAVESPGLFAGGKKFKLNSTNAATLEIGDFVVNNDANNPKLTRITAKVKKFDPATGVPYFEYTAIQIPGITSISGIDYITKFTPIQKFVDRFQFTALSGFKMTEFHMPGTPAQLEKILSVIETTNVGVTLQSKDIIQYRYIIDTFNGGLEPGMGPKQYLSRLAKNRMQCMAILNAPSMAEFQASTDPRFTELPDAATGNPKPVLNTEYISTGGNLSLGPSFTWSLPDEENGAKFIGVFTPNIILREDGKNKSIPPAAHVSNNFVRKFINGEPYAIVAGPRRGVISDAKYNGLEYDFLLRDREFLEPIGLNPITVVKNVGPMIYANQTGYQRTISAFNNLHVRDLLITIEDAVIDILQNYLFEFNDATTRLQIRTIVETYLDGVRNGAGIYNYSVIMDETNNTAEIIDQNFGIIDIGIEPARGLQKFINRITVLKTGGIASGGFAAI
jgi:hypothetical protein